MCTVSLNRRKYSEGTRLVLCLMNIVFGHEKRGKHVPPRPLPFLQRSRGPARAVPSMSLLSSAFERPPCGKSFLQLLPSHSSQWVPSFLTQAPTGQRETLSHRNKGEKDNRIGPCPLAPIRVHIGTCIRAHFIHDICTCTLHKCNLQRQPKPI